MSDKKNVFSTLAGINCNEHTEKKNGLTYLSWAWAWHHVKEHYPEASYTIYETPEGRPYFDDGRTAWVKTGVTIEGLEHIEYLPIMDNKNNSIPVDHITSMDMNKAIQRSLTKACARHGLGLYIYAGEDLPENMDEEETEEAAAPAPAKKTRKAPEKKAAPAPAPEVAAPAPAPEAPAETETDPVHLKWVKALALHSVNKNGVTAEAAYKEKFKPSKDEWRSLMDEVFRYQLANGISDNN